MRKLRAGSQRWYAERRARKAAGLAVVRMGRLPGRRKNEPIQISRARAAMDDIVKRLPVAGDEPFEAMPVAEQFDALRRDALLKMREVLHLPTDLATLDGDRMAQHRRYRLQLEAAQTIINGSIKLDDASLRHQQHEDWLEAFNKKLDEAQAKLPPAKKS